MQCLPTLIFKLNQKGQFGFLIYFYFIRYFYIKNISGSTRKKHRRLINAYRYFALYVKTVRRWVSKVRIDIKLTEPSLGEKWKTDLID